MKLLLIILNMVGNFSSTIAPLLGALVGLQFCYLAFKMVFEPQKNIYEEYLKTIIALMFCTFVAFSTDWYLDNIVPVVLYLGDDIGTALLRDKEATNAAALNSILDLLFDTCGRLWDTIDVSYTAVETWLHCILVLALILVSGLGFLPFSGISAAYLLVAKLMVVFY